MTEPSLEYIFESITTSGWEFELTYYNHTCTIKVWKPEWVSKMHVTPHIEISGLNFEVVMRMYERVLGSLGVK